MAAFASLTVQKVTEINKPTTEGTSSALTTACASNGADTASYGAYFTCDDVSTNYLLLIQNAHASAAKDVTIKCGNGIQGLGDLKIEDITAGKYVLISIDSGRFKNVSENKTLKALSSATEATQVSAKGKIFIVGESADIKVAVFKTL